MDCNAYIVIGAVSAALPACPVISSVAKCAAPQCLLYSLSIVVCIILVTDINFLGSSSQMQAPMYLHHVYVRWME